MHDFTKLDHVILENVISCGGIHKMRTWQSQELKKKIYKNDDNTGIFKKKLFKLRKVLDRAVIETLFIMGN